MKLLAAISCIFLLLGKGTKGELQELTDSNFAPIVTGNEDGNIKVVSFWAAWCGPCRILAPSLEAIAEEYSGRLEVYRMDTDTQQWTSLKYGIRSIPTTLVFKNGEVVRTLVGALPKSKLENAITPSLSN